MGILFKHFSEVPERLWKWDNFKPNEYYLFCPCCGEFYLDFESMDRLQAARDNIGSPIRINSGHRCPIHNARVGGAPLSQHKKIAFDISVFNSDKKKVLEGLKKAGFTTYGFYKTFVHTDIRKGRMWYGKGGKEAWMGLIGQT